MSPHFLQGIDTVIVRVSDIHRSRQWYTEKIGFNCIHQDDTLNLVVLDTFSPVSLTLWQTNEKITVNPKTCSYPIFRSAEAAQARQQLKEQGVTVSELITDHVVTYFTFYDPDENVMEVCQVHE